MSALTTSYCGGIGGVDDNAAQAGYVIEQPMTVTGGVTHTLTSEGADASEDGTGRGTPIVVQAVNENQRGEITTTDVMAPLSGGGGKPGQGYAAVMYAPETAATVTSGTSSPGVSAPGRRQEDDHNVVAFMHTAGLDPQASSVIAPTIKAGHDTMPSVLTETIVRRLTELECERLQGYPDLWTDGQSGSARYRQLGNSLAVPVVEFIAHRIVNVDRAVRGQK